MEAVSLNGINRKDELQKEDSVNRISRIQCSTLIFLAVVALVAPTTWAENSSDVQMQPGKRIVLRAIDYDARSFIPPKPRTGSPQKSTVSATFEVEYEGFSPEAQAAFQAAVDVWSTLVASPVTIKIKATWEPLGIGVLGSAGAPFVWRSFEGALDPDAWYPDPLADSLHGSNLGIGNAADIVASFNSNNNSWYLGTDGNTPNGNYDLMSVVLHEIGHGLGFAGSAAVTFSQGSWGFDGFPMAYDQFTEDGDGNLITDTRTYGNPSVELGDALQGLFVFWGGSRAVSVNEGERPHLYAPTDWQAGSSYSHLSEEDYPVGDKDSLMTPFLAASEAIHDPGPITLCLYQDIGWETAQDCGDGDGGEDLNHTYWVATASNASGAGGSQWRTRLGLFNISLTEATVEVTFHGSGSSPSTTQSISSGEQLVIDDIVGMLGSSGSGSLEIVSSNRLLVSSRTSNQGASGSFGQFLDSSPSTAVSMGINGGGRVWLAMLEESTAFRTNIGFTNTGLEPATVLVTLYDHMGVEVATFSVTIGAGLNTQENQPYLNRGGRNDITAGFASVQVTEGAGLIVYGSVIDNQTGDPITIPMKR